MNSRTLLLNAARELGEAGVPDPAYDAAALLAKITGVPPLALRAGSLDEIPEEQLKAFQQLVACRKKREPLQYLLGDVVFLGEVFLVRPGVLIPRPETALLAERAVSWLRERAAEEAPDHDFGLYTGPQGGAGQGKKRPAVLDMCCGTGCLGLSVLRKVPEASCVLTDLSGEALSVARENAARLHAECEILRGDLFAPVEGRKFDLILSNPPYIPSRECETLQPEVLREPRTALDGGADGLAFYRRIAAEASRFLNPGGRLMLEIGFGEEEPVTRMLRAGGASRVECEKDFAGIPRMIFADYE